MKFPGAGLRFSEVPGALLPGELSGAVESMCL